MEIDEKELLKKYNDLYLEVIMRYKDHIEEKENLYVAELPRLIMPDDDTVRALAKTLTGKFQEYRYEENFLDAAKLAFEYVKNIIFNVSLPIQFWLKPAQTINYGAGDLFDKSVLLCSLLIALGNVSAKIIIVSGETERWFIVYFEFKEKVTAMNIEDGIKEYGRRDDLIAGLGLENTDRSAYEFNDKMYIDIA